MAVTIAHRAGQHESLPGAGAGDVAVKTFVSEPALRDLPEALRAHRLEYSLEIETSNQVGPALKALNGWKPSISSAITRCPQLLFSAVW